MEKITKLERVKKLNRYHDINVIGCCANKDCLNELTREDEYLIDEANLYCDSICYAKYMLSIGAIKTH